jgi:hypothetical protein
VALTLNLGVLDVAYSGDKKATTTGAVAQILEDRYHVFEIFWESRKGKIAEWIAEGIATEIEDVLSGKRPNRDPFMDAMQQIETEFRAFLDADEISKIMPITMQITAAQMGHSKRFKDRYNTEGKRDARPALIDSGLFQASMRAFISGKLSEG